MPYLIQPRGIHLRLQVHNDCHMERQPISKIKKWKIKLVRSANCGLDFEEVKCAQGTSGGFTAITVAIVLCLQECDEVVNVLQGTGEKV